MNYDKRISTYVVTVRWEGNHGHSYRTVTWQTLTAQQAVNFTRQHPIYEGEEIVEVAKVVNNWK